MTDSISQQLAEKTMRELRTAEKSQAQSRTWTDPEGYQRLGVWQNAALLRVLIRVFTKGCLPRSEYRLKAQLDDAARSVKRNIEEGWKRPTTKEYLTFLGYSQASLEEVKGDIRDAKTDGFLPSQPLSTLKDTLGINLRVIKGTDVKGEPTNQNHPYFIPLNTLNPEALTYEIFIELINKTDWLLRQLVQSLERKLGDYKLQLGGIRKGF
ncbi:MAG: four helix bundle protein [Candidatus Roizmanbacteria bacterium]|nr:four helix bundle protein [Candidatus Roizmanbacteria bacterium]